MSTTPNRLKSPPKLIRILMLPLLIILLLLLIAYAALPYLPLGTRLPVAVLPTPGNATTETPAVSTTAAPTEAPSPTNTAVVPVSPTAAETEAPAVSTTAAPTEAPSPTNTAVVAVSPTVAETSAPPAPTELVEEGPGDMQVLEETAEPVTLPTATTSLISAATPTLTPPPDQTVLPTLAPPPAAAPVIVSADTVRNGSFSGGYQDNGVAAGWSNFSNSSAEFSFQADSWPPVAGAPDTGQTMRIRGAELADRYLGIYQTVNVVPGRVYTFSIGGLVRTNAGDVQQTNFGYRLQVGFDTLGGHNWKRVPEWFELPWDEQLRVQESYRIDAFTTTVEAETERLTIFVRAWKKWADAGEGAYDVTRVGLVGPAYSDAMVQSLSMPVTGLGETTLWDQVRVGITLLLLALLLGGALWRLRPWPAR